jgi:hypothetical protein
MSCVPSFATPQQQLHAARYQSILRSGSFAADSREPPGEPVRVPGPEKTSR